MTRAADADPGFRQVLADLAASRGGIYARAMANLNEDSPSKYREHASVAIGDLRKTPRTRGTATIQANGPAASRAWGSAPVPGNAASM